MNTGVAIIYWHWTSCVQLMPCKSLLKSGYSCILLSYVFTLTGDVQEIFDRWFLKLWAVYYLLFILIGVMNLRTLLGTVLYFKGLRAEGVALLSSFMTRWSFAHSNWRILVDLNLCQINRFLVSQKYIPEFITLWCQEPLLWGKYSYSLLLRLEFYWITWQIVSLSASRYIKLVCIFRVGYARCVLTALLRRDCLLQKIITPLQVIDLRHIDRPDVRNIWWKMHIGTDL